MYRHCSLNYNIFKYNSNKVLRSLILSSRVPITNSVYVSYGHNISIRWNTTKRNNITKEKPNLSDHIVNNITERDRMLIHATSMRERIRINVRWSLTRSMRPFNTDDISAFISWILVSNVLLIILGTTTFASLIIYCMNTVFAQEYVATQVGNFITKNSALSVVFESAIVPGWSSGKITFNKVFISKRPKLSHSFSKGSQQEVVDRAKLALSEQLLVTCENFDDGNYTQFDLTIDQVEISLSFNKWINGKGLLDEITINGLRGVIDRTHVIWAPNDHPRNYLNIHKLGDFEISKFVMNDVLFTLYQPDGFRPFQVSIFNCELPQLRKHWLFFDVLNANNMSGTYDNSMFTIYKKYKTLDVPNSSLKKVTRMRVDNLNVDHLNAGMDGPFGWITSGQVDMIGDLILPEKNADASELKEILMVIGERLMKEACRHSSILPLYMPEVENINPHQYFIMDFFLKLHNVKAEVPIFTQDLSYINNALIRPIVGYINSRKTYIPIRCRVVKNINDFEGSWTIYDSMLITDLSAEVYDAFAEYVADNNRNNVRIVRVGFWSLQILIQLILMGLGAIA